MMLTPGGAVLVGAIAAVLSVCGFSFVQPFLCEKLKIHDSCGVNNLHGMPGLLGGLLSVLMAGLATESAYGHSSSLHEIFPEMASGGTPGGQRGRLARGALGTHGRYEECPKESKPG